MDARVGYLLLGCAVGFILGYIVRSLREIKDKVDEVDKHIQKDDDGFVTNSWVANVALFLVVLLVAFSAFKSQGAANSSRSATDQVKQQQVQNEKSAACTQQYLAKTIVALNARTQYSQQQSDANVALQASQARFLVSLKPKPSGGAADQTRALTALNVYLDALATYISVAGKSSKQVADNPYPTANELLDCLKG